MGKRYCAMEGVEVSQTLDVTREVGRWNLSSSGLVRRMRETRRFLANWAAEKVMGA